MLANDKEIIELQLTLQSNMTEYLSSGEAEYSVKHKDKCFKLVNSYLSKMDRSSTSEKTLKLVKKTVVGLNKLNLKCNHSLIETDERESLAEIINRAAFLKGFNPDDDDLTEEWREW